MRLTRAAQRAQQIAEQELKTPSQLEREPLHEISSNESPKSCKTENVFEKKSVLKRSKSKGGAKKGAKGKKGGAAQEIGQNSAGKEPQALISDSKAISPTNFVENAGEMPDITVCPTALQSKAMRLTRRQLERQANQEVSQLMPTLTDCDEIDKTTALREVHELEEGVPGHAGTGPSAVSTMIEETEKGNTDMARCTRAQCTGTSTTLLSPEISSEPEPNSVALQKPESESYTPVTSRTTSRRASRSPSKSPMRIEESLEAIDALEEALEEVGKVVSHLEEPKNEEIHDSLRGARVQLSKLGTPSKMRKTRNCSEALPAPRSVKATKSSLSHISAARIAPDIHVRNGPPDAIDQPLSKRRPISISFPTPAPPLKGKAPTRPTFQLSGDAVAARCQTQKEERLKREVEGAPLKQRPISLPPPARSARPLTKANFQLPGEAVAAKLKAQREERQKREAERSLVKGQAAARAPSAMKSTKPLTKANFRLPGEAIAAKLRAQKQERQKREEEAELAKKIASSKPRSIPFQRSTKDVDLNAPGAITPPVSQSQPCVDYRHRLSSTTGKRSSAVISRDAFHSTLGNNNTIANDAALQRTKGKEVFNRDKMEKEARERERREKEEAAKKARADAAERGRIASREWAEKQRRKVAGQAAKAGVEGLST